MMKKLYELVSKLDREKIKALINFWRLSIVYILFYFTPHKIKKMLFDELLYWNELINWAYPNRKNYSRFMLLSCVIINRREYRNLLVYRLKKEFLYVHAIIIQLLFPLEKTLFINAKEIGECLFIQHGFSTIINAERIGSYCWINQQVTIGAKDRNGAPIIGNGVRITAGAKVIGSITIGNNAVIGANAVVVKDVGEKEVVGGVPAKRLRVNDEINIHLSK